LSSDNAIKVSWMFSEAGAHNTLMALSEQTPLLSKELQLQSSRVRRGESTADPPWDGVLTADLIHLG
jgi:hypothetical protein